MPFAGSSDWALPSIDQYQALFAAHGNLTRVGEFKNVQFFVYWSGTEILAGLDAWLFSPLSGNVSAGFQVFPFFAVAVRPGDVAAFVPEPQTLALALLALSATVVVRRRRH